MLKVFWDEQYREETQEFDSLAHPDAEQLLGADPTLEKHPALAEVLKRIDDAAQENLSKG